MTRFSLPDLAALTDVQRAVADEVRRGRRGTVPANVLAWLPSPELARRAAHLGELLRYETVLGARLSELAILVVARHWSADYEWGVHAVDAARAGVSAVVIADIGAGRPPTLDDDERIVVDVATALVTTGRSSDELFAAADAALGRQGLVELVGLVGYYTMVAMTLNAFAVPAPDGAPALPRRR